MITTEMLRQRMEQLQAEREQIQRNLFAYDGAIQDCQYWLDRIEKESGADE